MRPILVDQMVHVDEQRPEILHLAPVVLRIDGQDGDEFEEVDEERFGQFAEVEGVVERPFGGDLRGRGCGRVSRGPDGRVELGDVLVGKAWEGGVDLVGEC